MHNCNLYRPPPSTAESYYDHNVMTTTSSLGMAGIGASGARHRQLQ